MFETIGQPFRVLVGVNGNDGPSWGELQVSGPGVTTRKDNSEAVQTLIQFKILRHQDTCTPSFLSSGHRLYHEYWLWHGFGVRRTKPTAINVNMEVTVTRIKTHVSASSLCSSQISRAALL